MTTNNSKPAHEIRIGRIKATIWLNKTTNGELYNTAFNRIYRVEQEKREGPNDNGWREVPSFGRDDLLLLAKVADQAHSWIHQQSGSAE